MLRNVVEKPKGKRRTWNLSLVLWVTFSVFAVLILVLFAIIQNFLIGKKYREQVEQELQDAGTLLVSVIKSYSLYGMDDISTIMLSIANQYNVSAYLISLEGDTIYPDIPVSDREEFARIAQVLQEKLADKQGYAVIFQPTKSDLAYSCQVSLLGSEKYLYISRSLRTMEGLVENMRWHSVLTGLFGVVLAFVASGFVSMLITKPVVEVTERAKELARGNYGQLVPQEHYYCTELSELSDALDYAASEICKADSMQKELIANVSHDFKTPLTMIKAYASMIQEISGNDEKKRNKHTQVIIDESDRLTALVNDLLDLSKIRSGISALERTVFNLSEDVYSVVGRFDYLAETQNYRFETEIDENVYTYADRERVRQVLYNLIGNAVNYTGEDKLVRVRLKCMQNGSRFEVIDTGSGIPPEQIDTVWERYYRSSEAHKRPVKGTGLGLSIVKTILVRHELRFGILSEVGKGSCFWVEFNAPPAEENF